MRTPTHRSFTSTLALTLAAAAWTIGSPALAADEDSHKTEESSRKSKRVIDADEEDAGSEKRRERQPDEEAPRKRRATDDDASTRGDAPPDAGEEKPEPKAEEKRGDTDHEKMVGHLAVGWYGVSDVPVGVGQSGLTTVAAPAVGVRYWVNKRVGIDAALGLSFGSTSVETTAGATSTTTDIPTPYGVLLHGGVPLALTTVKHAAILVTPEFNLGFGGSTVPANPAIMNDAETSNSGLLFELGARAGAEVHFGFIGLPNLSLEGSLGVYLNYVSAAQEKGDASAKFSQTGFTTTALNNPWDFFRSSVAARYYF
ncbi:MAG: hypothetical protein FJ096_07840 [Deltaproteobacteria bacterium]|nr:hypothetical protein [Deltaproteobacteria bacterium]